MNTAERIASRLSADLARPRPRLYYVPAIVVLLAAAWLTPQWLNPVIINSDVSWLLEIGQRWLHGARPYVDFLETNPPASILIYMPAVIGGDWTGIPPEYALLGLIWAGGLGSLYASGRIAIRAGLMTRCEAPLFAGLALALLFLLPAHIFAQREQIALIAVMPMLAVYAARANGKEVSPLVAFLVGLGGGVTVSIKPHFALALIFPLLFMLWRARSSWRGVLRVAFAPENIAVLIVGGLYLASVLICFPAFIHDMLPMDFLLYVPKRIPSRAILSNYTSHLLLAVMLWTGAIAWPELKKPLAITIALAGAGFTLAYILQGKGYRYQDYPALVLFILMAGIAITRHWPRMLSSESGPPKPVRFAVMAVVVFLSAVLIDLQWSLLGARVELDKTISSVRSLPIPRPRIFAFSASLAVGQAPARRVGGTWVGSTCCDWLLPIDDRLKDKKATPVERKQLLTLEKRVIAMTVHDIRDGRPDVILIDGNAGRRTAFRHPKIVAALRPYREAKKAGDMEIWVRRDRTESR